ncbi:vWA domain-containing protein [Antarctobacter jejuensis]|uniref:vWA domain-containing protein n=1 Tax=Antarctobacter jejuensis TaxID=1439938 RepID=UPI003FCF34B3
MSKFRGAALALCLLPGMAPAQEDSRSILVLDASGSMWGQIDGVAKIEIAQGVVGDLLRTLPVSQEIGLTAYGHRTKGDCTDIETLIQPGTADRAAITAAVNQLKPRGKTPMTDAVKMAAEALRYTEDPATVILVSDGIETCNPDPCAAARALEEAGVNLTVHVVGFDVSDPEALRQMQCIADETGGSFLMAANASELGSALGEVTQAQPVYPTKFVAQDGPNGGQIESPLIWDLRRDEELIVDFERDSSLGIDLTAGSYTVSVLRPEDEASVEKSFTVTDTPQTITLVLPSSLPAASVSGPEAAVAGSTVPVTWDGPDAEGDYLAVSAPDHNGYVNYVYTRDGSPGQLLMPAEPGEYELRYVMRDGRHTLATQAITVTAAEATLDAESSAPIGASIPVTWSGPDYDGDYIGVSEPGKNGYVNYTYTREGNTLNLLMPPTPGTYELRYFMKQGRTVLATRMIEVTELDATLDFAPTAAAGSELPVTWTGPDYDGDYIAVSEVGEKGYVNYTYTREGAPLDLTLPAEPGTYEIRYFMKQGRTILASQTIEVTEVNAALDVVAEARAGASVLVTWDGPGHERDYVSVAATDMPDNKYIFYTYTREGSPLLLKLPAEPGTYEVRYVSASDRPTVIGRKSIDLKPVEASIDAPEQIPAGSVLGLSWDGPDFKGDYISIAKVGEPDNKYISYRYTTEDSPMVLKLPEGPGRYELRYVIGQGHRVLYRKPIELTYEPQ